MCLPKIDEIPSMILQGIKETKRYGHTHGENSVSTLKHSLRGQHHFFHFKSVGIFSDAQGQLTLQSVVGSGRISNSYKLLYMLSLPSSTKMIRSKTVEKKWQHRFPIISLWGFFSDANAGHAEFRTPPSSHACHRYLQV